MKIKSSTFQQRIYIIGELHNMKQKITNEDKVHALILQRAIDKYISDLYFNMYTEVDKKIYELLRHSDGDK